MERSKSSYQTRQILALKSGGLTSVLKALELPKLSRKLILNVHEKN